MPIYRGVSPVSACMKYGPRRRSSSSMITTLRTHSLWFLVGRLIMIFIRKWPPFIFFLLFFLPFFMVARKRDLFFIIWIIYNNFFPFCSHIKVFPIILKLHLPFMQWRCHYKILYYFRTPGIRPWWRCLSRAKDDAAKLRRDWAYEDAICRSCFRLDPWIQ